MITKTLLVALLVALAASYTLEGNVLVLGDDDFPGITKQFSHILIEFYAPWCGHCKKLAPVYTEVADALKQKDSVIKLAKLDATEHKKAPEQFGVRGYPTLFFFYNGEKMDYNGPRNKEGMLSWLEKRTRDPVVKIDADAYAKLSQNEGVSIVYHGNFETAKNAEAINKLAVADDYNTFYWGTDLGKDEGTIEIIRSFGQPLTIASTDSKLTDWISKHQRPAVVPFDERTIGDIFGSGKKGVVLFNGDSNEELLSAFTEAAKAYDGESLVFTQVGAKNEHLDNFASYIKLDRKSFPIVIIQSKAQSKYVLKEEPTQQNILQFLGNYKDFKVGITDEVKAEPKVAEGEAEADAEEL